MITSICVVSFLLFWCIYKVLTTPGESEHIHGIEQSMADKDL